ncbi:TonB-dependent receptor [Maribacter halichondriae]|uniref:TonB-dependent receptor n=1 Tax=Maribacter halichondriae TaxID=2980554 RepID=UPI0023590F05|nr:TonB-dependent receptor [Maribacter sp. Hal144]
MYEKKSGKIIFCFLCLFASVNFVVSQNRINGKVIDKKTGEPVPYCNIALGSSSTGTATNEQGEFVISVETLPASMIFSHLNYNTSIVEVSRNADITIEMTPSENLLDEITIIASKKDDYTQELVTKAFQKAKEKSNANNYGKAFYRQKSKNGNSYSEFSEIFYDIRYGTDGIKDWSILEGRYALKESAVFNRNYTILSRLLTPLQPDTDELIFLLRDDFEIFFNLSIIDFIQSGENKIAIINFKPLQANATPTFEGEVFIDTESHDILKIKAKLSRDDLKLTRLTTENGSWKDYEIAYEIIYKKDSASILDYIKVDQAFDYYRNDSLQYHTATTSSLVFFEHYTPTSRKKLGGRLKRNQSDWDKLDDIGYNQEFWANNPIVKRTPIEEEIISSFEKDMAFNSIFLNSAENIGVMDSDISQDRFIQELSEKMNRYNQRNVLEKVYLHTDRDIFIEGEELWYSAYSTLGSFLEYNPASKVLHVDLIGSNKAILKSQTHELVNGRSYGSLKIPKNIPKGNYQLRAYTDWMQNFDPDFFYTKIIKVTGDSGKQTGLEATNSIDLQFFPEGGYAVANLPIKMAFKAVGSNGLGKDIKGHIEDSQGKVLNQFNTLENGAGFFQLLPKKGEQYTAVLDDGRQFPLPKVLDEGYSLSINNSSENSIKVTVSASENLKNKAFYIIGSLRNKKYYQGKFEFGIRPTLSFDIPKTKIPSGVLTLTLFDEERKPWCERALFINNQDELVIRAKITPSKLEKRGKITLNVNVTDTDGRPISTEMSVAVTDTEQSLKSSTSSNILTHLLLESEVKGHIENPGLLFKDQTRSTLNRLDLVMMTHGWRKFVWPELWQEDMAQKEFSFSQGLKISGTAYKAKNRPLVNSVLSVFTKSSEETKLYTTTTDEKGKFLIENLNLKDSVKLVFNAQNEKAKPIEIAVELDERTYKAPKPEFKTLMPFEAQEDDTFLEFAAARSKMDSLFSFDNTTMLDEVTVAADRIDKATAPLPSVAGILPDVTIYSEDKEPLNDIFQLLSGIAGIRVSGTGMDRRISIRNGGNPLWLIDGVQQFEATSAQMPTSVPALQSGGLGEQPRSGLSGSGIATAESPIPGSVLSLDVRSIERIEVLKGGTAAMISALQGQSGIILIYTKQGYYSTPEKITLPQVTVLGHAAAKTFYAPKYDVKLDRHEAPDYRATLYWNPSINTDENGNAKVEFFNSDAAKEIQVSIEGLSQSGIPGSYLETFGN